jgi:putative FmdB family regulatory protein
MLNPDAGDVPMPAYEYECQTCGGRFERRQKMSETALVECPGCGGIVKRLISGGAGIVSREGTSQPVRSAACGAGEACCRQEMPCNTGCACAH